MGRFGAAAILAVLCSALCLYGSSRSSGDFQFAARYKLDETFGTKTWVHCSARCLRVSAPTITHGIDAVSRLNKEGLGECGQRRRGSGSSSSSDSRFAECSNHEVKTLCRELCSTWAQAFNSPLLL